MSSPSHAIKPTQSMAHVSASHPPVHSVGQTAAPGGTGAEPQAGPPPLPPFAAFSSLSLEQANVGSHKRPRTIAASTPKPFDRSRRRAKTVLAFGGE
jgi:hypothetical protein